MKWFNSYDPEEENAKKNADKLEKLILKTINGSKTTKCGLIYVKNNLLEWYYIECKKTNGRKIPNEQIVNYFSDKN